MDKLLEQGKLIEAGWESLRATCISDGATEAALRNMRFCFYAGAHHVFASLWTSFDGEEEATDEDVARVEHLHDEMLRFQEELRQMLLTGKTKGVH